jgi:hypothetical protein
MAAITAGEILWKLTTSAVVAGNSTSNTTPGTYLGGHVTSNNYADNGPLFPDVTGAQNAANQVDYAGMAIHNSNGANNYVGAVVYISSDDGLGASIAIGVDTTAQTAVGAASGTPQLVTIANSTTAPAGVTFSAPTTAAGGIALGTINFGNVRGFWVRRTAANTAARSGDTVTLAVSGDTGSL